MNKLAVVYYSTASGNTQRFVSQLDYPLIRITELEVTQVSSPYVLVIPTLSGGNGRTPVEVVNFLNLESNRKLCVGVIGSGDRNFGKFFCKAATTVAQKLDVPVLYRFELFGTSDDVLNVKNLLLGLEDVVRD
jgi:protein involved in ribonucleotide reduction